MALGSCSSAYEVRSVTCAEGNRFRSSFGAFSAHGRGQANARRGPTMNTHAMSSSNLPLYSDNMAGVNGFANTLQNAGLSGMVPPSPWAQNSLPPAQQQQPQISSYSYPQMQNPGLQTAMPGMFTVMPQDSNINAFNNALAQTLLPAQFLQDAVRLSAPVGSSANDDEMLAQALYDTQQNGLTYRRAIEALHGVNNHAANLWKDYYLDHKPRIDRLVASLGEPSSASVNPSSTRPPVSIKKPTESKRQDSPATASHPKRRSSVPKPALTQKPAPTRRKTFNSLTAPAPVYGSSMPAPNAEVQVPDPPSRSPTPPHRIVPGNNGNRYTEEDKEYFIKFISWRLRLDPSLTKAELCEKLAEKAPQHSQMSWASHWHSRHDLADKILMAAHAQLDDQNWEGSNEDAEGSVDEDQVEIVAFTKARKESARKGRPNAEEDSDSSSGSESSSSSYQGSDDSGLSVSTEEDEERMSKAQEPFNRADIRMLARYVATTRYWDDKGQRDRWLPFSDRYSRRSYKSWAEAYRKHQKAIHRFARRYKKQRSKRAVTPTQNRRARPSWATQDSGQKRKVPFDRDAEKEFRHSKRVREEEYDDSSSDSE